MVRQMDIYLRSAPGTIYLTVMGNFGKLWIGCWWDANVYDEAMVKDWVDEFAGATKYYLGDIPRASSALVQARL